MTTNDAQQITEAVKERYGSIALNVLNEQPASCCTPQTQGQADCCEPQATTSCCSTASGEGCCSTTSDSITDSLYQVNELEGLPLKAALASLGCGNPTALAELTPARSCWT
jgi:arsenite methyltransferase